MASDRGPVPAGGDGRQDIEDRVAGAIANEAPWLADDYCQLLAQAALAALQKPGPERCGARGVRGCCELPAGHEGFHHARIGAGSESWPQSRPSSGAPEGEASDLPWHDEHGHPYRGQPKSGAWRDDCGTVSPTHADQRETASLRFPPPPPEFQNPSSDPPEGEGQRVVLYDCAHNNARYAEPCDRCPVEGEGQTERERNEEMWREFPDAPAPDPPSVERLRVSNVRLASVEEEKLTGPEGEGQLTAEEANVLLRSTDARYLPSSDYPTLREAEYKLRALSRESRG